MCWCDVCYAESGLSRLKMVARLLVDRRVILTTSLYGLIGLLQVMMNEVHLRVHTVMYMPCVVFSTVGVT